MSTTLCPTRRTVVPAKDEQHFVQILNLHIALKETEKVSKTIKEKEHIKYESVYIQN